MNFIYLSTFFVFKRETCKERERELLLLILIMYSAASSNLYRGIAL